MYYHSIQKNKIGRRYCHWRLFVVTLQLVLRSNYELQFVGLVHLKLKIEAHRQRLYQRHENHCKRRNEPVDGNTMR